MRYFISFCYDGTNYHGWQRQPNGLSVQEVLEKALSTLLRTDVEVVGAGRTDAGVHARMMVAHMDIEPTLQDCLSFSANAKCLCGTLCSTNIMDPLLYESDVDESFCCTQLVYKLNKLLPPDISVFSVHSVDNQMHARFSATSRTYHYFIHTTKNPFLRNYSWQVYGTLDFSAMNEAAHILLEYSDFTSFSKVNTDTKTNYCTITNAIWEEIEHGVWRFSITANRFLRNMVRAIVGTLVEVGRGKLDLDGFRKVIEDKNRCSAGESVPGYALFLVDIKY